MKFVVYNVDSGQHVKLEIYRDLTKGANGGQWEKVGETIDAGGWAPDHNCNYVRDFIPVEGGGVVALGTWSDNVMEAKYKFFSIREIVLVPLMLPLPLLQQFAEQGQRVSTASYGACFFEYSGPGCLSS